MLSARERQAVQEVYWPFKNVLDPDDSEYAPRGVACVKISDALGRIGENHGGLYAFGGADCALPALPGLVVRDAGVIPIPLGQSFASSLLDHCTKAERDEKKWELAADKLWMKNPEWNRKIGDLGAEIAHKLGFQDVFLDVILSKLVVYEPGGHLTKRKDAEEGEDVVAALEVQLPSLHQGGDLVVYDDEDPTKEYRFDFGKTAGTADFKPSYAVFVAGAEYAREEVKKGYRVVLEYSIRLPPDEPATGVNRSRRFVQKELRQAMTEFGEADETFALLLDNEYGGYERFQTEGSGRLDGADRDRFQALQKANSLLPLDKRLKIYVAKIDHSATFVKDHEDGNDRIAYRTYPRVPLRSNSENDSRWRVKEQTDSIVWFSTSGEMLQTWNWEHANDMFNWTSKLNFLNPDHSAPRLTWSKHLRQDRLVPEKTLEYKAYAIVCWPLKYDLKNVTTLIGEGAALSLILDNRPVDSSRLRVFMNTATGQEREMVGGSGAVASPYVNFCLHICKAITIAGDVELVWLFFIRFFDRLKNKEHIAFAIVAMIEGFGWDAVRIPLENAINRLPAQDGMTLALELMSAYENDCDGRAALATLSIKKAQFAPGLTLISSKNARLLWECSFFCQNTSLQTTVASLFQQMDPSVLGPVVAGISECVDENASNQKREMLSSLVSIRRQWLDAEILRLDKPFTLQMPDARFPAHAGVEAFLHGRQKSFAVSGFTNIAEAQSFISEHLAHSTAYDSNASYTMRAQAINLSAAVIFTKTSEEYEKMRKQLDSYRIERQHLAEGVSPNMIDSTISEGSSVGEKRPWVGGNNDQEERSRQRSEDTLASTTAAAETGYKNSGNP